MSTDMESKTPMESTITVGSLPEAATKEKEEDGFQVKKKREPTKAIVMQKPRFHPTRIWICLNQKETIATRANNDRRSKGQRKAVIEVEFIHSNEEAQLEDIAKASQEAAAFINGEKPIFVGHTLGMKDCPRACRQCLYCLSAWSQQEHAYSHPTGDNFLIWLMTRFLRPVNRGDRPRETQTMLDMFRGEPDTPGSALPNQWIHKFPKRLNSKIVATPITKREDLIKFRNIIKETFIKFLAGETYISKIGNHSFKGDRTRCPDFICYDSIIRGSTCVCPRIHYDSASIATDVLLMLCTFKTERIAPPPAELEHKEEKKDEFVQILPRSETPAIKGIVSKKPSAIKQLAPAPKKAEVVSTRGQFDALADLPDD